MTVEVIDTEGVKGRGHKVPRQRERTTVHRRWEFEMLSRMKEKLLYKVEKSVNTTVKRLEWAISNFLKLVCYVNSLCTSSASRFAAFNSNRSYLPGD